MSNRTVRRARALLRKHLPQALALAHAMNDIIALDLHTMMQAAKEAGLPTFKALDDEMIGYRTAIITAKDRAERQALRDRIGTFNRAIGLYGYSGSALPMLPRGDLKGHAARRMALARAARRERVRRGCRRGAA